MPNNPIPEPDRDPPGSSLIALQAGSSKRPANTDDAPTVITSPKALPPSDPMLGLAVGSKLGHYELLGIVGTGGMAAVLRAKDLELGRDVALKILPPHMARDPENIQRFKLEARAAAKLDHDNVARVFYCGEDLGLHFIAFEFVEGDNLRALIDRKGQLSPEECVPLMLQVAAGLAHANERGVVHRDIKPSNILITPDGRAKIVDMGLARTLSQPVNGGVTQSGVTLGTFDYISPEQALDPRKADARSDIYSLGCTFYHALTGRPPVPEGTAAKKLYAHQHDPVVDPREYNAAVPDAFAAVLAKMMAKDPAKRYASPAALIGALATLARQMHLGADVLPADFPAYTESARILSEPPRLSVGLLAGAAILAVAVALLVGYSQSRPSNNSPSWVDAPPVPKTPPGDPGPPVAPAAPSSSRVANTAEELAAFWADPAVTEIRLKEGVRYDVSATKGALAVGKRLSVEGFVGVKPDASPVVRLAAAAANPAAPGAARAGTLTVARAESLRIRGVRFELTDAPPGDDPAERPVGLYLADVAKVELTECRFDAAARIVTADPAAVAISKDGPEAGIVNVSHCYFGLRRGSGLQFAGRLKVDIYESGFAPHPAAIALRDDAATDSGSPSELALRHSTFLLENGAAIDAGEGANWSATAGYCVFAAPPQSADAAAVMAEGERRPSVLRIPSEGPEGTRFAGIARQPNAYFGVAAVAVAEKGYSFERAAAQWKPSPVADDSRIELKQSPWANDPLAVTADDEPWRNLRLSSAVAALKLPKPVGWPGVHLLPSREIYQVYPAWPPLVESIADARVQVWYPNPPAAEKDNLPPHHHAKLLSAVAALRPGDALEIKHTGELPVPPDAAFTDAKARVTVRPAAGFRPILVPAPSSKYEQSLFQLVEGELTLEGLEIRLSAKPGDIRSAVTIVAGKKCTLKNCTVTLDEQGDEKLAAVILADPSGVMRIGGAGPTVRVENCFLRGRGRGIWMQSSRPFDLDVVNTAAALAGPLLEIDAGTKPPAAGAQIRVRFDRVTAAFAAPVLDFRPGRTRPAHWVPVGIDADACLFAALEKGVPFAAVDGADALEKVLTWSPGPRPNWYANVLAGDTFVHVTAADATAAPMPLDGTAWFAVTQEKADESLAAVTFAKDPAGRKLAELRPADLEVKTVELPKATAKPSPTDAGAETRTLPMGEGS